MPVTEQTLSYDYTGDGISTAYPFSCRVLQSDDLTVTVNGVTQNLGADYSLNGIGAAGGGSVVFATPPPAGLPVRLRRLLAVERETDYQDELRAAVLNTDLDRIVMMIQQVSQLEREVVVVEQGAAAAPAVIFSDAASGPVDVDLPASGEVIVIKTDDSANAVTLLPQTGHTVLRQASVTLEIQDDFFHLLFREGNWYSLR